MSTTTDQITDLIRATTQLKTYFEDIRSEIQAERAKLAQETADAKNQLAKESVDTKAEIMQWTSAHQDNFSFTDTLMDHRDKPITLEPRFKTLSEAQSFSFQRKDDYEPSRCYADLQNRLPAQPVWYSEPKPTQFTRRASAYANIAIGSKPHPNPKPVNHIALLHDKIGAHHRLLITGSPTPNYSEPRLFMGHSINTNLEIKGQSYGITHYDDLIALAENVSHNISIGFSFVRIINLGPYPIHIKGFWIIYHGYLNQA